MLLSLTPLVNNQNHFQPPTITLRCKLSVRGKGGEEHRTPKTHILVCGALGVDAKVSHLANKHSVYIQQLSPELSDVLKVSGDLRHSWSPDPESHAAVDLQHTASQSCRGLSEAQQR